MNKILLISILFLTACSPVKPTTIKPTVKIGECLKFGFYYYKVLDIDLRNELILTKEITGKYARLGEEKIIFSTQSLQTINCNIVKEKLKERYD